MSKTTTTRLTSLLLALLFVVSGIVPVSAAPGSSSGNPTAQLGDILNTVSYSAYHADHSDAKRASREVVVKPTSYSEEGTTAEVEVQSSFAGRNGDLVLVGDSGKITWNVDIPETGLYALKIDYCSVTAKTNTIERTLYVNGKVPFSEARYLRMSKTWVNEYEDNGRFALDVSGNELRPTTTVLQKWSTYTFMDSNGYITDPLELYLEKGTNSIALEAVREPVVIGGITLFPLKETPSYADVAAEYAKKGYKPAEGAEPIKFDAELPSAISNYTIYPLYDRSSAVSEPQDATKIRLNTIGGFKWESAGQWIEYEFTCQKSGLYNIVTRFRQNGLNGLYASRRLYINGEIPFVEANLCQFAYGDKWQTAPLMYHYSSDPSDVYNFDFYFEEGKTYTIKFEVTVGYLGNVIETITNVLNAINADYLEIIKLTGADPDENRSYGFARVMPDTIIDLYRQSEVLADTINYLTTMSGVKGENITTLEQTQRLLAKMGSDESQIAGNLASLKTYIGSLGTWINTVNSQPLELDYLIVQPSNGAMPRAEANFWESLLYQVKQFFGSFVSDYNNFGVSSDEESEEKMTTVEVWTTTGRDQAQIMRNLIDNSYRKQYPNSTVNLKLVASGTLLPSVLAGAGPDVALSGTGGGTQAGNDIINYAIRNAILPLNDFDTFDTVTERFSPAAIESLSLYGTTYGLPDTQSFPMMFYRKDILANLGLEIPKTWDDILGMIPVLQYNNMTIGLRKEDYQTYLYQMGGNMWADDGMRINLDSNTALEAFEMSTNMFTQYSLDVTIDFANRLRTGHMPIGISDYTIYNTLIVFATEIAGLWEFCPIPGIRQPDGTINNVAVASAQGIMMMKGCDNLESAWDFMDWFTDKYFQVNYSNELVSVLGDAAKNPTANMQALEELDWTANEYKALYEQMQHLVTVTPYPGNYIISRYADFAFLAAYNDLMDPVEELLGNIAAINKEITRKRTEFGLETLEAGQTLAAKRMEQAAEGIAELKSRSSSYQAAIDAAVAAIDNKDMNELTEAANLFAKANGNAVYDTVDITKQSLRAEKGGYRIDSLGDGELVYFISQCLSSAAYWLSTYQS